MNLGKFILIAVAAAVVGMSGCSVEQTKEGKLPTVTATGEPGNVPEYEVVKTEEGEMPSVEVNAEGGQLPEVDVDTAEVTITTEEKSVTVPDVDISTEEKTIEVPDVDVKMPDDN